MQQGRARTPTMNDSSAANHEASHDEFDIHSTFARVPETVLERFQRLRGPQQGLREGDRASLRDHLVMEHTWLVAQCARLCWRR